MKTLKTIIACLILAISCVAFVGCDKEKEEENSNTNSIVGTWCCQLDSNESDTWDFSANGTWKERYRDAYGDLYVYYGTYVYNPPYLTITEDGESYTDMATVNGDVLMWDGQVYYRL